MCGFAWSFGVFANVFQKQEFVWFSCPWSDLIGRSYRSRGVITIYIGPILFNLLLCEFQHLESSSLASAFLRNTTLVPGYRLFIEGSNRVPMNSVSVISTTTSASSCTAKADRSMWLKKALTCCLWLLMRLICEGGGVGVFSSTTVTVCVGMAVWWDKVLGFAYGREMKRSFVHLDERQCEGQFCSPPDLILCLCITPVL